MKMTSLLSSALLLLSVSACGDDDDDGGGGGGPDAAPGVDSAAGTPDAAPDEPDGMPGEPDATPSVSQQIQAARDASDGALSQLIDGAFVTYVKAGAGNDPAGFFLQAEPTGPALFVAIDPGTLTPAPAVGDQVSLTVTEMASAGGRREATMVSELTVSSSDNDVSGLVQDVSAATDLVTALDDYADELIAITGTLTGDTDFAGTGFVAAELDTAGVTGDASLRLRLPETLQATLALGAGCSLTVTGTPMWRFNAVAQPSLNEAGEASSITCPAPAVTAAAAPSATEVLVSFSRPLAADSVLAEGTQFTIDNDLSVSAAAVASATQVLLTTAAQVADTTYTVTVADTVTDTLGTGVDAAANTAVFDAFAPPDSIVLNEVDYNQPSTDDAEFIELYNPNERAVDLTGYAVILVNGATDADYNSIALSGSLPAGGFAVISFDGTGLPPGVLHFAFGAATNNIQNGSPDGIAVVHTPTSTLIDALSYEGEITAAALDGFAAPVNLVEGTATSVEDQPDAASTGSLIRSPDGADTDDAAADWSYAAEPTPGQTNVVITR